MTFEIIQIKRYGTRFFPLNAEFSTLGFDTLKALRCFFMEKTLETGRFFKLHKI